MPVRPLRAEPAQQRPTLQGFHLGTSDVVRPRVGSSALLSQAAIGSRPAASSPPALLHSSSRSPRRLDLGQGKQRECRNPTTRWAIPSNRPDCVRSHRQENPGLRWVGIDEAGYGPNLGPLVMTAVVAEATDGGRPGGGPAPTLDLWGDLAATVDRAGGDPGRLWVDDSKAILRGGKGRDRLESACLAALHAAGLGVPGSLRGTARGHRRRDARGGRALALVRRGIAGDRRGRGSSRGTRSSELLARRPLEPAGGAWRLAAIESVVVGPARFNAGLEASGSKAEVHFAAFARLLRRAWDRAGDGAADVRDRRQARRPALLPEPLSRAFPDAWIDRGPERPESSRYTIRDGDRRRGADAHPEGRPDRRAGRAGVDRQQGGPGALDGRLQRVLVRASPRAAADRRLSGRRPAVPPGHRGGGGRGGMRSLALVADQVRGYRTGCPDESGGQDRGPRPAHRSR